MFGPEATHMLFMKLEEYHEYIKPFVEYLNYMPIEIMYEDRIIGKENIIADSVIEEKLKGI